jgi:rod shape-determining protein MreC
VEISRHGRRRRLTLVLLVITSLALVSLDERGSGVIDSARTAAQDVVGPLQDIADDVIDPVAEWFSGLGRANELQGENERLRRQLAEAQSGIAAAKADSARTAELEGILDLPDVADADAITAEVIGVAPGNFSRAFTISKGASSGIALDMPVVVGRSGKSALVGKVVRVSSSRAVVQRIDDASFGSGAQLVQGDEMGPTGFAEGQRGSNLLRFTVVDESSTSPSLNRGDVVITGGENTSYPRGLVIGTVVRTVGAGGALSVEAPIRPVVDLQALTLVKVLKTGATP